MSSYSKAPAPTNPTPAAIAGAITYVVLASAITLVTVAIAQQPGWVWALRIITVLGGVGLVFGLIAREKSREHRGLPLNRDAQPFDLWTIAHTTLGLVMGAWGVLGLFVVIFTIGGAIFEWKVLGF